jgi:hypothetical protein
MVEGYRRDDPPPVPQLAVPIIVPQHCFQAALLHKDNPKIMAIGSLTIIAFFYLLQVGEYTQPRTVLRNGVRVPATRTKQFQLKNIGFFKDGKVIPRSSPAKILLSCDAATLKISNQKNGHMGETIHQEATKTAECPIQALAHQVHHVLSNGGNDEMLICAYFHNGTWTNVTSEDIIKMVRTATKQLHLQDKGIDPDLVGAHSLRAGGAMALKLATRLQRSHH